MEDTMARKKDKLLPNGATATITMLRTITTDPAFKSSDAISFPNKIYGGTIDGKKIGALVVLRRARSRGSDFAISASGLEYLEKAQHDGRIDEGYVVFFQDGHPREFIAAEQAKVVHDRLRGIGPQAGNWGPYWWVTAEFTTPSSGAVDDDEVPF
jgi:hypothetical protein